MDTSSAFSSHPAFHYGVQGGQDHPDHAPALINAMGKLGGSMDTLRTSTDTLTAAIQKLADKQKDSGIDLKTVVTVLGTIATGLVAVFGGPFAALVARIGLIGKALSEFAPLFSGGDDDPQGQTRSRPINERFERFAAHSVGMVNGSSIGSGLTASAANMIQGFAHAITSLTAPIQAATAGLDVFVAALSPGVMTQFNQAVRDLNATIGAAFLPVFTVLTETLDRMAGELDGAMHELAPVMQTLAEVISAIVLPVTKVFAASLSALVPFFQKLADLMLALADAMRPLLAVVAGWEALGQILASVLSLLEPAFQKLVTGVRLVSEWLLKLTVALAKSVAASGLMPQLAGKYLDAVKNTLRNDRKSHEHAAGNVSLMGVDALNKQLQTLAFGATGTLGEPAKSDTDRLLEELDAINPNETLTEILTALRDLVNWVKEKGQQVENFKSMPSRGLKAADDWAQRRFDSIGVGDEARQFGGWVNRKIGSIF